MNLSSLTTTPPDFEEAWRGVSAINRALSCGLSRLPQELRDELSALSESLAATPLGPAITEGFQRLLASEFTTPGFLALAAARTAVTGAMHDALYEQAAAAFDLKTETAPQPGILSPGSDAALLDGVQQWLGELAVTGAENLDEFQLAPFETILSQLQARERWSGLASLLTGFLDEMMQAAQLDSRDAAPAHRWADLWSAAMLGAQTASAEPLFTPAAGTLHLCGVEVCEHRAFVTVVFWGLLAQDETGPLRVVCAPFSSWKVSVASREDIWKLFEPGAKPFLSALSSGQALSIQGELSASGELRATGEPELIAGVNPFELKQPWIAFPAVHAAVRNPVHLVQMVRFDECSVANGEMGAAATGVTVPIDLRVFTRTDLDSKTLEAATDVIALLRWDAGKWKALPICLQGKGKLKNGVRGPGNRGADREVKIRRACNLTGTRIATAASLAIFHVTRTYP